MRINVKRDADFAVSHQVLQRFRVHARFRLIATVGMAADVRGDRGHLFPIDRVILFQNSGKDMLPIHRHHRANIFVYMGVQNQKARISVFAKRRRRMILSGGMNNE